MAWNPDKYNSFKSIRYAPFYDLVALIQAMDSGKAIDIGCGTGEQTSILSAHFPHVEFLGIDTSPEMLSKSGSFLRDNLQFELQSTESILASKERYDLLFSNAALQWSDDHHKLFPALLRLLAEDGQFAVQMPMQKDNVLNQLLLTLASEDPFRTALRGWTRESPLLTIDEYAQLLFEGGLSAIHIVQKVYPIIATDADTLYDFIAGSALIPYLERLDSTLSAEFVTAFIVKIKDYFRRYPAFYAFKRILLYGRKID